jgi:hypothetical protein
MKRKHILSLLAVLLLATNDLTQAQQPRIPRIGILRVGKPPDTFIDAFRQGLDDVGYVEGQNIVLEYRWMNSEDQLTKFSEELAHLKSTLS